MPLVNIKRKGLRKVFEIFAVVGISDLGKYFKYLPQTLSLYICSEKCKYLEYMSCISKTACFSVNCASLSLQSGRNKEPKGSNWSHLSELDNRTPPSKSDTAPFWRVKTQPIRDFPAIEPAMF